MMNAGDIIYIKDYPDGYTDAVIKSVSTHSLEGYDYGHPIASVHTLEGELVASMMEHDLIREQAGVWWER